MTENAGQAESDSLHKILKAGVDQGASDIHLKTGRPPAYRVDGKLRFTHARNLTGRDLEYYLEEILGADEHRRFDTVGDADHAYTAPNIGRFRVNCYRQRGTAAIVMRHVKSNILDFDTLNLPKVPMERIASLNRGLVLVTGTTSSGKSTTLAALLDVINRSREGHIVTLEDPIEFIHSDERSSISQREVGIDTRDFKTGLRAVMREDPDVILIGEMRDAETFQACMAAAETGHLVFSTLHTTNVMMTVDRIVDMFPPDQHNEVRSELALQLKAIVSQRLLPRADGKGRVPAVEIMFNNPGIAALIRHDEIDRIPTAIAAGHDEGMMSFNTSLAALVQEKLVTQDSAEFASDNPEELKMELQGVHLTREHGGLLKKPRRESG